MSSGSGLEIIAKILAIPTFVLSSWNWWYANLRRLKLRAVREDQVQLMQTQSMIACNIHCIITASGPSSKWTIFRFLTTNLQEPSGDRRRWQARSFVDEAGLTQRNRSRVIPLAIKGGDSHSVGIAYQTAELREWQLGTYEFPILIIDGKSREIRTKRVRFDLIASDLDILRRPGATLMKELLPV